MAGRLRCSLGAAALAALLALPAPAQAAPGSTPAAQAWSNAASATAERRPAPRVRRKRSGRTARSARLGSRGLDDGHVAPAAIWGYGPATVAGDGLVR